jgi:predicted DCC family thiol-disulfide oxidoreductase YuxK
MAREASAALGGFVQCSITSNGCKDSACDNRLVHSTRHAVVVFDGECAFCNRWVDFLLHFDRRDVFRFTARQSESGTAFSRQAGLPEGGIGSIIVVDAGRVRSSAVLRMFSLQSVGAASRARATAPIPDLGSC